MGPVTRSMARGGCYEEESLGSLRSEVPSEEFGIEGEGEIVEEETVGSDIGEREELVGSELVETSRDVLTNEETGPTVKRVRVDNGKDREVNWNKPRGRILDINVISNFWFEEFNHAIHQGEHMLIGLRTGETICFAGAVYITPIVGSVSVLGATLSSSIFGIDSLRTPIVLKKPEVSCEEYESLDIGSLYLKRFPCYSSRTHSLLTIESKLSEYTKHASFEHQKHSADFVSISNFHNGGDSYSPYAPIEPVDDPELRTIIVKLMTEVHDRALRSGLETPFESYILVSTIPNNQYLSSAVLLSEVTPLFGFNRDTLIAGFDPIMRRTPNETALDLPPSWLEAMDEFAEHAKAYVQETDSPVIGVVCGRKNAGKSTFSKVMTNRLLRHIPAVAFINCDIGQTEFTPPGMLALHFITEPILGPSFTQLRPPAAAYYVGEVQVKYEFDRYIHAIKHFVDLVVNRLHPFFQTPGITNVPIIINTLGWISGDGLELFNRLLEISFPSHIFQLGNFRINVTDEVISSLNHSSLISGSGPKSPEPNNSGMKHCQIKTLPTLSLKFEFETTFSNFTALRLRMLAFSAYFNDSSSPSGKTNLPGRKAFYTPLVSQIPYVVPWNRFELWTLEGELDVSQVLYAFNGALVGLCETKHHFASEKVSGKPAPPKLVKSRLAPYPPASHYNCLGLGIIRGIDASNGNFHILTPLPYSQLSKVNALVKGELNIPINHLTNQVQSADTWAVLNLSEFETINLKTLDSIPYTSTDSAW